MIAFRDYSESDESDVLSLNQSVVELTSPLDTERLSLLRSQHCQISIVETKGETIGVMMCFTDGTDYDSINYRWFSDRIKGFLYIDRIIVAEAHRGTGCGQQCYQHLKQKALTDGLHWLAAEINSMPPNTGSLEFHRKQGFINVGTQSIEGKTVSMQLFGLNR